MIMTYHFVRRIRIISFEMTNFDVHEYESGVRRLVIASTDVATDECYRCV